MIFEFRLPDIGEGVVEGEVVRWMVKAGDEVREDQPMVEVMTDKATVEIPSPRAGRIASIDAPEGKMCAVGQVMVRIDTGGGAAAGASSPAAPSVRPAEAAAQPSRAPAPPAPAVAGSAAPAEVPVRAGRALATPATRRVARELGVDLQVVAGTGRDGRITSDDVRAFAAGGANGHVAAARAAVPALSVVPVPAAVPAPPSPDDERIPFRGVRKKIAENMSRSVHTAAHFTYVEEADLTELVALRARARKRAEERGVKLSFLPFIVKAVVSGLRRFPIVNSTLDEERAEIVLRRRCHIGIATASPQGLIVPVVHDADRKSLFEIAAEIEERAERARTGKAAREELAGSTFTISSLGTLGGVLATPIINFPEVAVLGVHKIRKAPVVRDGEIVIRDVANFSISLDHRIVDGYEGAQFLEHVLSLLSDPTLMFMELV